MSANSSNPNGWSDSKLDSYVEGLRNSTPSRIAAGTKFMALLLCAVLLIAGGLASITLPMVINNNKKIEAVQNYISTKYAIEFTQDKDMSNSAIKCTDKDGRVFYVHVTDNFECNDNYQSTLYGEELKTKLKNLCPADINYVGDTLNYEYFNEKFNSFDEYASAINQRAQDTQHYNVRTDIWINFNNNTIPSNNEILISITEQIVSITKIQKIVINYRYSGEKSGYNFNTRQYTNVIPEIDKEFDVNNGIITDIKVVK